LENSFDATAEDERSSVIEGSCRSLKSFRFEAEYRVCLPRLEVLVYDRNAIITDYDPDDSFDFSD
jgi:hypothetical protein